MNQGPHGRGLLRVLLPLLLLLLGVTVGARHVRRLLTLMLGRRGKRMCKGANVR